MSIQSRSPVSFSLKSSLLTLVACVLPLSAPMSAQANNGVLVSNNNTRGSFEQQLALAPTNIRISAQDTTSTVPLVSEDFESLPLLSDDGDLHYIQRPSLKYDPSLARSQVGTPVYVGQFIDSNFVPGLPLAKDPSLAGGERYYGKVTHQLVSLSPRSATALSNGGSGRDPKSKLLVPKPKSETSQSTELKPQTKPALKPSLRPATVIEKPERRYLPPLKSQTAKAEAPAKAKKAKPAPNKSSQNEDKLVARILFSQTASTLPTAAENQLKKLAVKIKANPTVTLRLRSYAGIGDSNQGTARRLSLARALSVRKFFISEGIPAERMDIRSLESEVAGKESHRLDVFATQGQS